MQMDDPVNDIHDVVHKLTQGSPQVQEETINAYFTSNASFTHPFCRTGSFEGSRLLIHAIFRWYKVMSPQINLTINGVAYDSSNLTMYVDISQVFAVWFIPFYSAPVRLVTVLQLTQPATSSKYYIQSQNDLYQVDQFVRFVAPWGIGSTAVLLWHFIATFFCVLLALFGAPVTWVEQLYSRRGAGKGKAIEQEQQGERKVVNGTTSGAKHHDEVHAKLLVGFGSDGVSPAKAHTTTATAEQFGNMQVIT